ncbi:MAG: arylsulfatase [Planctomycetota bacterium]
MLADPLKTLWRITTVYGLLTRYILYCWKYRSCSVLLPALPLLLCAWECVAQPSESSPDRSGQRPNVILIMVDDQGYGDLSAHGNPVLRTPSLDRLHAESVRFTDFHVAPMCSPTRGQLITGRDAMKNGCTAVCQGRSMVRADIPTMAEFFANAGYATSHIGKWHMGDSYPHRPQDRGFQDTLHHRAWGITSLADHWGNDYFDPVLNHNGVDKQMTGYCTDIFFDYAMDWITSQQQDDGEQPFFMYLATNTPHVPDIVARSFSEPYEGTFEGKPIPAKFFGMIANIDTNVGRLEQFLMSSGLRDNTVLIYMSDNGTQSAAAQEIHNAGMRGMKTSVYEGGHRVPFFLRWPAGPVRHGRDASVLTQVQDVLPTLIEICNLDSASGDNPSLARRFDGMSFANVLESDSGTLPDRKLVIQYRVSGEKWDPAVVLWNSWRLVNRNELYNITSDPGQASNVIDQHPEIAEAMEAHYDAWYEDAKPQFDIERWIRVGTENQEPMMLYAQDWVGDYCDNLGGLTDGWAIGYWNIEVVAEGVYEIELWRWPDESGLPLNAGYASDFTRGTRGQKPIVAANVQIAGENYTLDSLPDDTSVVFRIHLEPGKHRLQTNLLGMHDQTICSAMYTRLTRLSDGNRGDLTDPSDRVPRPGVRPGPVVLAEPVTLREDDVLMTDFEGDSFGSWVAVGEAFASGPVSAGQRVVGHEGDGILDTFIGNGFSDQPTGTLTSPAFEIDRERINFRIGGGRRPGETCVNLRLDGEAVRSAIGNATKDSNGRKILQWVTWDVSEFKGRTATIEIVDAHTGGWGHIVVDQIYRSDRRPQ